VIEMVNRRPVDAEVLAVVLPAAVVLTLAVSMLVGLVAVDRGGAAGFLDGAAVADVT